MAPKPKAKAAAAAPPPVAGASQIGRVQNARALRQRFADIKSAPEGIDADPLTVPKCVECPHCKWPVYARESKPATKRTFERAGIVKEGRDDKAKDADKQPAADGAEGDPGGGGEDGGGSDGSETADTMDKMLDKIDDLEEKNETLTAENERLTTENKDLAEALEVTQQELADAQKQIIFLEKDKEKWRNKCRALGRKLEEANARMDRLGSRIGDCESDIIRKLYEIRSLRALLQRFKRRRRLMMDEMDLHLEKKDNNELSQLCLGFWRGYTAKEHARREWLRLDAQRVFEVKRHNEWLGLSLAQLMTTEADRQRLKRNLKDAAMKLLQRSMGYKMPNFGAHAFMAWTTAYPALQAERSLLKTTKKLELTEDRLLAIKERGDFSKAERDQFLKQRDEAREERDRNMAQIEHLLSELGNFAKGRDADRAKLQKEAEDKARKAKEAFEKKLREELAREMAKLRAELEEQLAAMLDEIAGLEAQLKVAKSQAGGGGFGKEDPDLDRVVPKGQGVLCVGCMKQLLHRKVQPLPIATALKGPSPQMDEKKHNFFQSELGGMPDPDDPVHSYMWAAHKDPTGLTRYRSCTAADPAWARQSLRSKARLTPLPDVMKDFKSNFR